MSWGSGEWGSSPWGGGTGGESSTGVVGNLFRYDALEVQGARVLRARFTRVPKTNGVGDPALQCGVVANWTLDGPVALTILTAGPASDDDEVIDLHLDGDLVPGTWTLSVESTVESADSYPLNTPYEHTIDVADLGQRPISLGATNDLCEDLLRKFLNPAYRRKTNWEAVLEGIATGDCIVRDIAKKAANQLYVTTASDVYLDKRAADYGLVRPTGTDMVDELFRKLVTTVVNNKLTQSAFLQVLEVFYGAEAVRGYAETEEVAPFVLGDGGTLRVYIDERGPYDIVFRREDFQVLRRATAAEVAAVITRTLDGLGSTAYSLAATDPVTGDDKVRIYSGTRGLASSVRVAGGSSQPALEFPTNLRPFTTVPGAYADWTISLEGSGTVRFTADTDDYYNLSNMVVGDYVVINGAEFDAGNRGWFVVTDVYYAYSGSTVEQWFEVYSPDAVAETVTQTEYGSLVMYRPTRHTQYDDAGYALVSQSGGVASISIPATTQAVSRSAYHAAYANVATSFDVPTVTRLPDGSMNVTVTLPSGITTHGLSVGDHFLLDEVVPNWVAAPSPSGGSSSGALDTNREATGTSYLSIHSVSSAPATVERALGKTVRDADGDLVLIGGQTQDGTGAITTSSLVDLLELTETTLTDQARQYTYQWSSTLTTDLPTAVTLRPIGLTAGLLAAENIIIVGGYETSPWTAFAATNIANNTFLATKRVIKEELLSDDQLINAEGIAAAIGFYALAQPVSGDNLTIKTAAATRTYQFVAGGDVVVALGATLADSLTNLAAAINGDGSAVWGAVHATGITSFSASGLLVVYEDAVIASKSSLRAYGTWTTQADAKVVEYSTATVTQLDYSAGTGATIATSDPGSGRAGFHRDVTELVDLETHYVRNETRYWRWNAAGPAWVDNSTKGAMAHSVAAGTAASSSFADAAIAVVPGQNKAVITGGSVAGGSTSTPGLHQASTQVLFYNQSAPAWTSGTALRAARMQHGVELLDGAETLVIGGREPARYVLSDLSATITHWHFDETAAASATFAGPVTVNRNANARPVGKVGWGALCTTSMESTGGGSQATLNTALLAEYTIMGWMTSKTGCVAYNGVPGGGGGVGDNTLFSLGVRSTDDKIVISWLDSGAVVRQVATTATRTSLMPVAHSDTKPRYYHVAVTKDNDAGNVIWTLYVNGRLVETWTSANPPASGGSGLWTFGATLASIDANIAAYTGCIDHWGFAASILTAGDIRRIYLSQVGCAYDDPARLDAMPVGNVLNTCEVVNATTGFARRAGSMTYARFGFGSVRLPDGRIIVAGGVGYDASTGRNATTYEKSQRQLELNTAEVFDPETEAWTPLPPMMYAHSHPAMAYIEATNRVYITGGFDSTSVEYLDVATMRWHVARATLGVVRGRASGGLLGDDILALLGGGHESVADNSIETTTALSHLVGVAAEEVWGGGLATEHQVAEVVSTTVVRTTTGNHTFWTQMSGGEAVLTPVAAATSSIPGPFIFDPSGGFEVGTGTGAVTTRLEKGHQYPSIVLGSGEATTFPDEPGYLVFRFGYSNQVGPVRYLGRLSDDELALDASFVFTATIEAGATIDLVASRAPYVHDAPETIGAFYLTGSSAGRVGAQKLVRDISAAGIELDIEVRYPGDRGLGGEGYPAKDADKLSDKVAVWGGDDLDAELEELRHGS